jgi:hypothetical protein
LREHVLIRPASTAKDEDGKVAIDTNLAENAIWLFGDTVSGAKVSAHL